MKIKLFFLLFWAFSWLGVSGAHAQLTSSARWQMGSTAWVRNCASLDMDFYNDRYFINNNTTCNVTAGKSGVGTFYTSGSGNTGIQNFIAALGGTFTRAGTTNITDTNPPFYIDTSQGQAFVSRASVTNNVTSTFAPFYMTAVSQSFVSRASSGTYIDNTGTLQTASTNIARNATYSYNGSSWVANTGTLIEPTATNQIRNNTATGVTASSATQLATNPGFTSCTGNATTYTCNGWTPAVAGTATVAFASGSATLTGDGTNAAAVYQKITTVNGNVYTVAITTGTGSNGNVQVGQLSGGSGLLSASPLAANSTTYYNFIAGTVNSYVQILNTSASAVTITNVSVTLAGKLPTNWAAVSNGNSLAISVVGSGTVNGINYVDLKLAGTSNTSQFFALGEETASQVTASIGQNWTHSAFLQIVGGSTANLTAIELVIQEQNSSGNPIVNDTAGDISGSIPTSGSLAAYRASFSTTLGSANTGYVRPAIALIPTSSGAINITLRIGMPQLEQNAYATSVISTSSAAVARSPDIYNQQPASYVDGTGTVQFAAFNVARDNHNPASPYADLGTLIEPSATNSIRNDMMVGVGATDGLERTTNGTLTGCTGSTCSGWTTNVNGGTGTVTYPTGVMTLKGDGTNAASAYTSVATVAGSIYTVAVSTGTGTTTTVQAGTAAGGSTLLAATAISANTTTSLQFVATGAVTYIQLNNVNATNTKINSVSLIGAGTAPTNWTASCGNSGLQINVVGNGTENGINYTDMQIAGTSTALTSCSFKFETNTAITAAQNQSWTASGYVKLAAGSWGTYAQGPQWLIQEYDASGTYLTQGSSVFSPVPTSAALSSQRFTFSYTTSNASTGHVSELFFVQYASGKTINATVRVGMPQMEQSSYSTSVMPTFGSSVTRSADVYSAPSGGTYFNSSGVLKQALPNIPRLDHSPVSPFPAEGLLVEESRTNLISYSVPDNGTFWTYSATAGSANVASSPDGNTASASIADTSASSSHYAAPTSTVAFTSGTSYSFSLFAKASSATAVQLALPSSAFGSTSYADFNLSSGAVGTTGLGTTASIQPLSGGWYRCSITSSATSSVSASPQVVLTNNSTSASALPSYSGSGQLLYAWGAQTEAGLFPTSYISTSGGSSTRAADILTFPTTGAGSYTGTWFNAGVGTLGSVGIIPYYGAANFPTFASLDDGTGNNRMDLYVSASTGGQKKVDVVTSGSIVYGPASTAYTAGAICKEVIAFQSSSQGAAIDGTLLSDGTIASLPTISRLSVGVIAGGNNWLNGWVNRIWYQPVKDVDTALPTYSQ